MPKFPEYKKGEPLKAEWVNAVSKYLTNLAITGDNGICVAKKENGFAITNQIAPKMRLLYTYELDNEGYPYEDTEPNKYRCIDLHPLVNAPPTDPDDSKWVFVTFLKGAIARNQQFLAYLINGEWYAFNIPAKISGNLSQDDNGDWQIGQQPVSVPYDASLGGSADWVVDNIPVTAEWQADNRDFKTGYLVKPPAIIMGNVGTTPPEGTGTLQTFHWYSGGMAQGDQDFEVPVHSIYQTEVSGRCIAGLDHTGMRYIIISADCNNGS